MVITKGTGENKKITTATEGRALIPMIEDALIDTTNIVQRVLSSTTTVRSLKKIPNNITIIMQAVKRLEEIFEQILKYDGHHFLSTCMLSEARADEKVEKRLLSVLRHQLQLKTKQIQF